MAYRRRIVALGLAGFVAGGLYIGVASRRPSLPAHAELLVGGEPSRAVRQEAAEILQARVRAIGEPDARVHAGAEVFDIATAEPLDPRLLREISRIGDVALRSVDGFVGFDARDINARCREGQSANTPGELPRGCYTLGAAVWDSDAIVGAVASRDESIGQWVVDIAIAADDFARVADDVVSRQIAIVVNSSVLAAPVVDDRVFRVERELTDGETAQGLAAVIAVHRELPFEFLPPVVPATTLPPTSATTLARGAPRVKIEHWHAALGINVCGRWLPSAPAFENRADDPTRLAGIHSHGEGLVHVHPFADDEAGSRAVLGQFFDQGGWHVDARSISVWNHAALTNGERCPNGVRAQLRWWVDGVPHNGNPADWRVREGQAIVIAVGDPSIPYSALADFPARKYLP